eukprot:2977282-Pyramimonas_sp.AAC.2
MKIHSEIQKELPCQAAVHCRLYCTGSEGAANHEMGKSMSNSQKPFKRESKGFNEGKTFAAVSVLCVTVCNLQAIATKKCFECRLISDVCVVALTWVRENVSTLLI